jgi:hypothetical protein
MKSLFTDNFPFITNDSELQALKDQYPDYDSYYVASGSIQERKEKFDRLYQKYHSYADRHFLTEVKKKFHQRTWEMYLGCALLHKGITFTSKDQGPDFLIEHDGKKIWIECIACEKGDGVDRVPDLRYGVVQSVPSNEMLIRIASALKAKHEKYKKYLEDGTVEATDQFVIAVCRGDLGHVDAAIPLVLRVVFAIGHPTITMPRDGSPSRSGWSTVPFIEKQNGSRVPMTFFLENEHAGISAVIYSKDTVLNHPDVVGEDIVVVHNKLATNPLSEDVLDSFKTYKCDTNGDIHL